MNEQILLEHVKIRLNIPIQDETQDALLCLKIQDAKDFFLKLLQPQGYSRNSCLTN